MKSEVMPVLSSGRNKLSGNRVKEGNKERTKENGNKREE